jgi:hypothetical protein
MAQSLSHHFEIIWVAEYRSAELARLRMRLPPGPRVKLAGARPDRLPFAAASFDCIVLHGLFDWWPTGRTSVESAANHATLLADSCRMLKRGGCLLMALCNVRRYQLLRAGSLVRRPSNLSKVVERLTEQVLGNGGLGQSKPMTCAPALRKIERALSSAGFRNVRSYYAHPSYDVPRYVIPRTRQASLAFERALFREMNDSPLRRAVAMAGLHEMLYGAVLYLAYA